MAKFIRYALATFCFAASVGCLALWWRSDTYREMIYGPQMRGRTLYLEAYHGSVIVERLHRGQQGNKLHLAGMSHTTALIREPRNSFDVSKDAHGRFGRLGTAYYFPLWYPALVFALAAIAAIRIGRRFTIRSAIIATTVVAGLLGMVVIL
jgi:hypothetical protein